MHGCRCCSGRTMQARLKGLPGWWPASWLRSCAACGTLLQACGSGWLPSALPMCPARLWPPWTGGCCPTVIASQGCRTRACIHAAHCAIVILHAFIHWLSPGVKRAQGAHGHMLARDLLRDGSRAPILVLIPVICCSVQGQPGAGAGSHGPQPSIPRTCDQRRWHGHAGTAPAERCYSAAPAPQPVCGV